MRRSIVTCDGCGREIKSGKLSIAMFPYQELMEYCDDCAPKVEKAVREVMNKIRKETECGSD